jgi:alcohol dehydrogenase (NADP+)
MHWPVSSSSGKTELDYVKVSPNNISHLFDPLTNFILQTWKSLIDLPKSKVLNIGISNFSPKQLRHLISETGVKPAAHQMELHPYLQQSSWIATHQTLGISVTAYSPLGNSNPTYHHSSSSSSFPFSLFLSKDKKSPPSLLQNKVLKKIAERRHCTAAQVALSWGIGRGTSVIPKSSHEKWIKENYESLKCELGVVDLVELKEIGVEYLTRFNNPSKGWRVRLFKGLDDA